MIFISEPTECPCCSSTLEKVNDQLFCRNTACSAKTSKKVEHFAKVLGIKGLGPKSIEKLQLQEITELFYLEEQEVSKILGEKVAVKLLDEIERAKLADFGTVIESFSIPLIGGTAAKKLSSVVSNFDEITPEICKAAGLGDKATENVMFWLDTEYKELQEFLPFNFENVTTKANDTTGKLVCITGKLKSFKKKADAEGLLRAAGYTLVDSVTKQTAFLVDENDSSSSKREKAIKYGITIITDLNDLLKENN